MTEFSAYRPVARFALVTALLISGLASMISSPARAQDSGLLSTASVTPADVAYYAEIMFDSTSDQVVAFDALLAKLGSEDSLVDSINESVESDTFGVDLNGAEIGIAVLKSALEAGVDATNSSLSESMAVEVSSELVATPIEATPEAASSLDQLPTTEDVVSGIGDVTTATEDAGTVLVIRAADINVLVAAAEAEVGEIGQSEEYLGYEIVSWSNEGGSATVYTVIDDFMVIGSTVEDVKLFVDASLDGGKSLASVDQFQTASELLPQERLAFAFANGPLLLEFASETYPEYSELIVEALSAYGGYSGMAVIADQPGIRFESVQVPVSGGGSATPSGSAADLTIASRVPAETSILAAGFDLGRTTVLKSLALAIVGSFASLTSSTFPEPDATPVPVVLNEVYGDVADLLGFNLKTGFLDQLTGPYGFAAWTGGTDDLSEIGAVLVSGVTDATVLGDTIFSITTLVQAGGEGEVSVASRPVEGGTVNNVQFDVEGTPMSVDYGIVGDEFVLGLGGGVDALLAGMGESLADSSAYQEALSYLPGEYQGLYYVDVAALEGATGGLDESLQSEIDMMTVLATPVAEVPAITFAAVTHVEDGYEYTSAILVIP